MIRKIWIRAMIISGLTLSACECVTLNLLPNLNAQEKGSRGNRGGDGPRTNRGAPQGGQSSSRGNSAGAVRRGSIHVPPAGDLRRGSDRVGQPSRNLRTPSLSRPGLERSIGNTIDRAIGRGDRDGRVPGQDQRRIDPGRVPDLNRDRRIGDRDNRGEVRNDRRPIERNQSGLRSGVNSRGSQNFSGIDRRPYGGNVLRFNNRDYRLGSSNYRPSYSRHRNYYGSWSGGSGFGPGGGYGDGWGLGNRFGNTGRYGGYRYRPTRWGLGGWGLGSLLYSSGYLRYSNPYYVDGGTTVYNYAQPVPVVYASTEVPVGNADGADQIMNEAVSLFQQNNLDAALDVVNKGISSFPDDAVLHEFRALVLFARQDYQQAASTIHAILAVGPGWNWTTMAGMYSSVDVYTGQLRALEEFTRTNPDDAASQLLLSYHYLTCGHPDAAALRLKRVVELVPSDAVAADLLRMVEGPADADGTTESSSISSTQQTTATESPGTNPPPIDPATVIGTWSAKHEDGSAFQLNLTSDNKFQWSFSPPNQEAEQFAGTFSLGGNILVLERTDGGSLVGELSSVEANGFRFKLVGVPESDPGLKFSR